MGICKSKEQKICEEKGFIIDKKMIELVYEKILEEGEKKKINVNYFTLNINDKIYINDDTYWDASINLISDIDKFHDKPFIKVRYGSDVLSILLHDIEYMSQGLFLDIINGMVNEDHLESFEYTRDCDNNDILMSEQMYFQGYEYTLHMKPNYYDVIRSYIDVTNKYANRKLSKSCRNRRDLECKNSFYKIIELPKEIGQSIIVDKLAELILNAYIKNYKKVISILQHKIRE